jgi:hypothetical protein
VLNRCPLGAIEEPGIILRNRNVIRFSKPWSNVEVTGIGPSARKLFSQRKKHWRIRRLTTAVDVLDTQMHQVVLQPLVEDDVAGELEHVAIELKSLRFVTGRTHPEPWCLPAF